MTIVGVERGAVLLEAHPPIQEQPSQSLARFVAEGCGAVGAAADFRRVDPEQPDAANRGDDDRVAVDHRFDEDEI